MADPAAARAAAILLVDDEGVVRHPVAEGLRRFGHAVTEADSGEAARSILADPARPVDLLITDFSMPGIDGLELARLARELRPALPILLMSGREDLPAEGVQRVDRMLVKPFRRADLLAAVAALVDAAA